MKSLSQIKLGFSNISNQKSETKVDFTNIHILFVVVCDLFPMNYSYVGKKKCSCILFYVARSMSLITAEINIANNFLTLDFKLIVRISQRNYN